MGKDSEISWTHHTFNPWWGCTKVSEACRNCYAEAWDARFSESHWGPGTPRRTFGIKHWNEPLKWNRAAEAAGERHRVFCASMADVFDVEAPAGELDKLWPLIQKTPWLDWLLLSKRPERARELLPWVATLENPWPNVWVGTSVEDQKSGVPRIEILQQVPAAIRFLSCEPLLQDLGTLDLRGIDLVIVGGESGPGARPMHPAWVRSIRDQCIEAKVAFHMKQWGDFHPEEFDDGAAPSPVSPNRYVNLAGGHGFHGEQVLYARRIGKKAAGRELDGKIWDQMPGDMR